MCAWDKGLPIAGRKARYIDDDIRDINNVALEAAIDDEHDFTTGGTQTGQHTQGSARCFFQDAAPSTRVDGTAFTSTDFGSLWIDSNSSPDNQFNVLTAIGPVTWTPVSTEIIATLLAAARVFASTLGVTGDFAVNTDKFTVAAATGNTAIAGLATIGGTLGVTGVATLGDTSKLATSAAPAADAQLANKKYVDDQIDATVGTGAFSPLAYAGEGSVTFPNGLIIKMGLAIASSGTVTFAVAFPNGIISVTNSQRNSQSGLASDQEVRVYSVGIASFSYRIITPNTAPDTGIYWVAIGW